MKISKRLKLIASLVDTNNVIDVGCDHALLDIYLTMQEKKCTASDISSNVLVNAKRNIIKYNMEKQITLIQSNGLNNIDILPHSTIVIAGMGAHTIFNILKDINYENIDSLIIQANNDLYLLRQYITNIGYYIEKEKTIFDKNKYYVVIRFKKGRKKYTKKDYLLGNLDKDYYKYLLNKNRKILKKIKWHHLNKKIHLLYNNYLIKQKLH